MFDLIGNAGGDDGHLAKRIVAIERNGWFAIKRGAIEIMLERVIGGDLARIDEPRIVPR